LPTAGQALIDPLLAHGKRLFVSFFSGRYNTRAGLYNLLHTIAFFGRYDYQGSRYPASRLQLPVGILLANLV